MKKTLYALMLAGAMATPAMSQTAYYPPYGAPNYAPYYAPAYPQANLITPVHNVVSRADCIANFRIADFNRDGYLTPNEVDIYPTIMPTWLLNNDVVSRQSYLRACRQLVRDQVR